MERVLRNTMLFVAAFIIAVTGAFIFNGIGSPAYADVGSVADNEDVTYDKDGGVLKSIGIDTSVLPDDYDPDSPDNPYGSDLTSLSRVNELGMANMQSGQSELYGHNANLDGKYSTLMDSDKKIVKSLPFSGDDCFAASAACDLKGTGRDQSLAIVYAEHNTSATDTTDIKLVFFDPKSGDHGQPIKLSSLNEKLFIYGYMKQSMLQITCGDYDNDSVDEVAVYVPPVNDNQRARISVFDLVNGKDAQDPYSDSAWQLSWNYVLPETNGVIEYRDMYTVIKSKNLYNNVDLVSGDVDKDNISDLIISYGASINRIGGMQITWYDDVYDSVKSRSVLLHGSDKGQMLKASQDISYDGNDLIRVSFALGDLNDDGTQDVIMGGQLQSEQHQNTSRVLGKYVYDEGSGELIPDLVQNMKVVDGDYDDNGDFRSQNGWDEHYYSSSVLKANLAVGKIYGEQSDARIYLDSVLYSYNGEFSIEDEMEDMSTTKDKDNNDVPKGSRALTDIKDGDTQCSYYEYGAQVANFTGGDFDYLLLHRGSAEKESAGEEKNREAVATRLVVSGTDLDDLTLEAKNDSYEYDGDAKGSPYLMVAPDTDIDGTVAEYTGSHKIVYEDPEVVAVLASAPYFKDVAAYDNGEMLHWCSTGYGKGSGESNGYEYSKDLSVGVVADWDYSAAHFYVGEDIGRHFTSEWGHNTTKEFTMSYEVEGGEDAVVLHSTPREYFEYNVTGVIIDDNGKLKEHTDKMYITFPHKPVTQTLALEDYVDIQAEFNKTLPDVKQYFSSTPGDPSTYPKSENDIPKAAKDNLAKDEDGKELTYAAKNFAGVSFGGGKVTQSYTVSTERSDEGDNDMDGLYSSTSFGGQGGVAEVWNLKVGAHVEYSSIEGKTHSKEETEEYSASVANMPRSAKDYGYDFSWKLFEYNVSFTNDNNQTFDFPIVTYIVDDVTAPPSLPDKITQDFDKTTDSQTALTWTYNTGEPEAFEIYKYQDFPQGGGDLLVGTVAGSDYRIKKDENGKTVKDSNGHVVHEYTFIDKDLTADTKYQYRMKVKRSKFPPESIFSPVIIARTDVSQKPDVSLSSNNLKIYPDGIYHLSAVVADPQNYEGNINYQWQKYDKSKRIWNDVADCTTKTVAFYKSKKDNAGTYRCRVNLVRKVESNPQYISVYTDSCDVSYAKRSVQFGKINVFDGDGSSPTNTGVSVSLTNTSAASVEKPTGTVQFRLEGANSTFIVNTEIDEQTGVAKVDSLEDGMGSLAKEDFRDGGYKVTARYGGSDVFYAMEDPEEYHYLRNIEEAMWLSAKSSYIYGEDIMKTARLYDYKKSEGGVIVRTDITDKVSAVRYYAANDDGEKTGNAVHQDILVETGGISPLPLHPALGNKAYVEVYMNGKEEPVGHAAFDTEKMITKLSLKDKMTGIGNLLELYGDGDIKLSGDGSLTEKNIITDEGKKSLSDLMQFKYYEDNGDFMFDSSTADQHKDDFIPAAYVVKLGYPDLIDQFFKLKLNNAKYMVVGNYYKVKAACSDENAGVVSMISPDSTAEYNESGYAGGTKLIFKAVPNKGYRVKCWKVNECGEDEFTLPASDTLNYTVKSRTTSGTGEINISAVLEPKDNTLSYGSKGQGSVEVTPNIDSGSTVIADTDLTFKATPDQGWKFVEWKWINDGGSNSIAKGTMAADGTNTKTFKMPDNAANVYAIFMRATIDLDLSGALDAAYINDGSNPLEETGKQINTDSGQDVPKGTEVIVSTKKGYGLAADGEWKVTITTPDRTYEANVEECVSNGQDACKFTLPEDVTACKVVAKTEKGKFSVDASADDTQFEIKVDGVAMEGQSLSGIDAGSNIEIKALPDRGRVLDSWSINGEKLESKELIYSTTITENLSVTTETSKDEKLDLKLKASGGGTAQYVITDKNGKTYTDSFGADEITPNLYKGESLSLSTAESDTKHTMTAVSLNGKNQALDDNVFEMKDISEDADIICRFTANTYSKVNFTKETRGEDLILVDENNKVLDEGEGISVPYGDAVSFKVILGKQHICYVYDGDTEVGPVAVEEYDENRNIYTYELSNVTEKKDLIVRTFDTYYIETTDDLKGYFHILNTTGAAYPDAVVKKDIILDPTDHALENCNGVYDAVFDGQGHTIKGVVSNPELFNKIGSTGCVKDVAFEDVSAYIMEGGEWGTTLSRPYALLANVNQGTISGVLLKNAELNIVALHKPTSYTLAGIATANEGTIKNCKVSGLQLTSGNAMTYDDPIGCAGVLVNQTSSTGNAVMKNNYFEGIMVNTPDGLKPAAGSIVANPENGVNHGQFKDNYFKATYAATDPHGTNVFTLTEHPDDEAAATEEAETPAFARKVAHTMNYKNGEKIWGINSNQDTGFIQLTNSGSDCKAPLEANFITVGKSIAEYLYPGDYDLPGEDLFGENTPTAWVNDDRAYAPGYKSFTIEKDIEFTGVDATTDYVASVSSDNKGAVFFKELADALQTAMIHNDGTVQNLNIFGECEMKDISFTIDPTTVMTLTDGAKLTMRQSAQITNEGNFVCEQGSEMHKYGTIQNKAEMEISGTFYNYGSKLTNKGTITHQESIICKPHCMDNGKQAEKPNDDGTWNKTSTCDVCGKEVTENIDPNPGAGLIDHIVLRDGPDKEIYEVNDTFTAKGMGVTAELTNGDKAVITDWKLSVDGQPLAEGDVLDQEGTFDVTVSYDSLTCGFKIEVRNTADLLTISDQKGNEISETEMTKGRTLDLTASLKHKLAENYGFRWKTSDSNVVRIDGSAKDRNAAFIAKAPGKARITATVVDGQGNPIAAIDPKVVEVTVVSHITALEIIGGDKTLDAGTTYPLKAKVTPTDYTDELTWSSSNEDVATVDDQGVVTTLCGGKTIIRVESPDGISANCKVTVYEKAGEIKLDAADLPIALNGYAVLSARVEPATANGEVTWTIDNPSTAKFYVKDDKGDDMKAVDTVTTKLSADGTGYSDAYVIVAGQASGTAVITAATEGLDGSMLTQKCNVTVSESADSVTITHNGAKASGKVFHVDLEGRSVQLFAESTAENDVLTWSVIDDETSPVIKVNSTGRVTLLRTGTAALKVTSETTGASDVCMFKVRIAASDINLFEENITLIKGKSKQLTATLEPEEAEDTLTWTSTDESVVKVSDAGKVTAVGVGNARVMVATGHAGVTASCKVTVKEATYTVTFVDGLGHTLKKQTVTAGKAATAPKAPTRQGYYFNGWNKDFSKVTSNMTVTAKWHKLISIQNAKVVLSKTKFKYNGKVHKPAIRTIGGKKLKSGTDYTVKWSKAKPKSVGKYTVTITGKGKYTGKAKASFKINPKGTKIKKIKRGKKYIKVKWTKQKSKMATSRITGYQIKLAKNKKFTKGKKTIKVKGYKKTTKKIKKLKKGKKYYVKIRTYKTVKGKKYYSAWSKVKTIKTRK